MLIQYSNYVKNILNQVIQTQIPNLPSIAEVILDRVAKGGKFRIFASGHSHIITEEMMKQTGGFQFPQPYNPEDLFGHPLKSGYIERNAEFGEVFYRAMELEKGDVLWLISNSGTNGVVVELAKLSQENDIYLVAQTNMNQTLKVTARHPSKKKMYEYANAVIDNCGNDGDAAFETVGQKRQGPTSNIIGTFIFQALNVCFVAILESSGCREEDLHNGNYLEKKQINIQQIQYHLDAYIKRYFDVFDEVVKEELTNIEQAASCSVQSILENKRNFMFGMAHDHSLVEEIHARAGTIMCNKSMVMQNTEIQFYESVEKAHMYASIAKYGEAVLYSVEPQENDTFFLVSQSASELALVRMIQVLKEKGCKVILHTNKKAAQALNSTVLNDVDVLMDNHGPSTQLMLNVGDYAVGYPATSIGCFINQCYIISMTKQLYEHGIDMPTRISINTDKGFAYTENLNRKYFNDTLI